MAIINNNSGSLIIFTIFTVIMQLTCFPLEMPSGDDSTLVLRFKRQLGNIHIADHALVSTHDLKAYNRNGQQHDTVIVNVPDNNNNNNYRNPNNNGGTTVVVVEEQNSRYPTGRNGYGYYRSL